MATATIPGKLTDSYGLDEEAIKVVKAWKFKPAKFKGQPVAYRSYSGAMPQYFKAHLL